MAELTSTPVLMNLDVLYVHIRLINNVLRIAQQAWMCKLGGVKPVANENARGIIIAGPAKRVGSEPAWPGDRSVDFILI